MKKILRDIPTSLLLLIGMFVLLFLACYSVNFVTEESRLNAIRSKEICKNTLYYYLYDGDVTVNDNVVTVEGSGVDIVEAAKACKSETLNIAFRLSVPFEDVMYNYIGSSGGDLLDIYTSYNGSNLKMSTKTNVMYLNETHKKLVKNDKIDILKTSYYVAEYIKGRMSGITMYDKLDDDAIYSLLTHSKKFNRISFIIGSDSQIDMNEVERIKKDLSDHGFTLLDDSDNSNLSENEAASVGGSAMISVGGLAFVLITLYILIKLWLLKRIENVAILWCHGKSKYGIFVFLAKEMSLVYGMAAVVFALFALLYSLCMRNMPLIYIPIAVMVAYVLLMMVAIMVYESAYRKLSMLSVISGGVE